MTTITLKINERTKAGKAFMAILDFFKDSKTIEVVDTAETEKEAAFMKDIETALREVKQIQEGKLRAKPLKELILPSELDDDIPQWQKTEALKRLKQYKSDPHSALDFNQLMNEIEEGL